MVSWVSSIADSNDEQDSHCLVGCVEGYHLLMKWEVGGLRYDTYPENTNTDRSSSLKALTPALMCSINVGVSPFL